MHSSPAAADQVPALGECALEGCPVAGPAVGREHMLDTQREQRAQPLGDLIARYALGEPHERDLEAVAEVDRRVAGNDRTAAFATGSRSPAENRWPSAVSPPSRQATSGVPSSGGGTNTGAPSRSTRLCVSRSCHGHVSTTTGSRSAASSSISLGTDSGSNNSRRSPSSMA